MAVSGTISTTTIDTMTVIDRAYRRCKIPAQRITPEMIDIAKEELYLAMSEMVNRNVQLWALDKVVLPLTTGKSDYAMPSSTVEVTHVLLRQTTDNAGTQTTRLSGPLLTLTTAANIITVGWTPATAQTRTIVVATSADGVTYTVAAQFYSTSYTAGQKYWFDIQPTGAVGFVSVYDATLLAVDGTVTAGSNPTEIPLGVLNQDQYVYQPNKTQQGRPTNYWQQRLRDGPVLSLYQTPSSDFVANYQLVVWRRRYLMDVGTVTQTLDVPQRWYDTLIWMLAWRLAACTPEVDASLPQLLEGMAEKKFREAAMSERNNAPIQIRPNIGVYTR